MSARNTLAAKQVRRSRRALTKGRLPAYINLVEWIKLRSSVTTGTAKQLLLAGTLRVDSHKLGYIEKDGMKQLQPFVKAALRGKIEIHSPDK